MEDYYGKFIIRGVIGDKLLRKKPKRPDESR